MKPDVANLGAEVTETIMSPPNVSDDGLLDDPATSDDGLIPERDADSSWEHRLDKLRQRIEELQETYDQSYLEIGRVLIQARDVYKGHGDWIRWLKENVPFSVRHAQRLIRVAEMFSDATLVSRMGLTSSKAYILTRLGKDDVDHFLNGGLYFRVGGESKSVKNMTKRELELAVTIHLKGKLASTDHEEVPSNQGDESPKDSVESSLKEFKKALNKTIFSIKKSDSSTRDSWISELEDLFKAELDQLTSASE